MRGFDGTIRGVSVKTSVRYLEHVLNQIIISRPPRVRRYQTPI
jgi:hypothetical protein